MFEDHFNDVAIAYQQYRPTYPPELFDYLAGITPAREAAWDAGTGNGQAAVMLAERFAEVIASDASSEQIRLAPNRPNIEYYHALSEISPCADHHFDLVCVAQALHWFDFDEFYSEVRRVLKPGGVLAVIGYSAHRVNPAVDAVLDEFESQIGPFWPPQRAYLEAGYCTVPFPFREIETPSYALTASWTHAQHLGYLKTWSALKPFIAAHGYDPVERLTSAFTAAWGDPQTLRTVTWKLHVRVGRRLSS